MKIKKAIKTMVKTLGLVLFLGLANQTFAQDIELVETVKDEGGWRLTVDGRDFPVKGVVWAYTPIGENHTYDLWSQSDDFIQRMIDTDMVLLRAMGANTIRSFSMIPPEWIEYIYDKHGIYTMVNDLFGRYGVMVDGTWYPNTDYSNPRVRKVLLDQYRRTIETYKNTRGVLMFMLGNESNYGLEWKSDAIENLPSGERLEAKARFLYSLMGEAMTMHQELNPNHPVGIVNGDLQYLAIIQEECKDLDILGVNSYRGPKAYDLFYESVAETLDKPMVYTEVGADAYNVAKEQEDQIAQAAIILSQVEEMYLQYWDKGKSGNLIGAYMFEWIDEWWKHGMDSGLEIHDTQGTWNNGAYSFDSVPGKQNMNEEWFGIVAQSTITDEGINRRIPRAAYYTLQKIWELDPTYASVADIKEHFAKINPAVVGIPGLAQSLTNRQDEEKVLEVRGSLNARGYMGWTDKTLIDFETIKANANFRQVETATLGFTWNPTEGLIAGMDFRAFGGRFHPTSTSEVSIAPPPADAAVKPSNTTPIEIYSAFANYEDSKIKADFYYHTGHPDWYLQGDFFGLLPEAFDTYTMDRNGSQAPFGIELQPKGILEGLTLYTGPELYYGGFPMAMAKYYKDLGKLTLGVVHQEELAYPESFVIGGYTNVQSKEIRPLSRATSLYFGADFLPIIKVDAGALLSRPETIGKTYTKAVASGAGAGYSGSNWNIYENQSIGILDTLAAKVRLETNAIPYSQIFVQGLYAGAVADSKAMLNRAGSQIADPGSGNRMEVLAGGLVNYGYLSLAPKFIWRKPVLGPVPDITGTAPLEDVSPRSFLDPFHVWANREKLAAELVLAWDPTGATWFFDWNNSDRENANLAGSVSFLYNFYEGPTDAKEFVSANGTTFIWEKGATSPRGTTLASSGLPAVSGTWSLEARAFAQPMGGLKMILTADAGQGQSTSIPDGQIITYAGANLKVLADRLLFEGGARVNAWGPDLWYREFNLTYPLQWQAGASYGFAPISFLNQDNRVGFLVMGQTLDKYSDPNDGTGGAGTITQRIELQAFVNLSM